MNIFNYLINFTEYFTIWVNYLKVYATSKGEEVVKELNENEASKQESLKN